MPRLLVTVAPLGHEVAELPQFTHPVNLPFQVHLLLVLVGRGMAPEGIDNHINGFVLPLIKDTPDIVIIRSHPSRSDTIRHAATKGPYRIQKRFPESPIGLLQIATDGESSWELAWADGISPPQAPFPMDLPDRVLIDASRFAEFATYVSRPSVLLPPSDLFHYEAPSGSHHRAYVRGAFAFLSQDSLDGLGFWAWPKIPRQALLLVAEPTLLAVGLGLGDYMRCEIGFDGLDVPTVEAREYYSEEPSQIASRLEIRHGPERPVVVVSSLASSGHTGRSLEAACHDAGFSEVRHLTLFSAKGTLAGVETLHDLSHLGVDLTRSDATSCDQCLKDQPRVRIQPDTNLVEVSALFEESRITIDSARQAREFLEPYVGVHDLVTVHRHQHDDRRHHVIDIDVGALCRPNSPETDHFMKELEDRLGRIRGRNVVIVHPRHKAAGDLAKATNQIFGWPVLGKDPEGFKSISAEEAAWLKGFEVILLVDDVAITGSRLRQYRLWLNAKHIVSLKGQPAIGALVGVLRPARIERKAGILSMVDDQLYFAVHEVLLPDWQERQCPWCAEAEDLNRIGTGVGTLLDARREHLRDRGLINDLLIPWDSTQLDLGPRQMFEEASDAEIELARLLMEGYGEEEARARLSESILGGTSREALELGPRSIFGPLETEAQVFFAVASALQVLRSWERHGTTPQQRISLSETFTSPVTRVLAPEHYISGRFYAPIILGSILRAVRRFDVQSTAIESRLKSSLAERFRDHHIVRPEMLYAMKKGVLPPLVRGAELAGLAGADESVRSFLTDLN